MAVPSINFIPIEKKKSGHIRAKCVKCMGRPKGGRISGGRDTSSGAGRDTSSGAGLSHPIGLPKPVLRKGRGKAEKPSKENF